MKPGAPSVKYCRSVGANPHGGYATLEFHDPEGLACDYQGNVIVADEANHRIVKFDGRSGQHIWTIGRQTSDGRPREGTAPGEFRWLRGVCTDRLNCVYVADSLNCRIQKFSRDGEFLMMFGSAGNGPGQFGGEYGPNGVAVDEDGFIYIADSHAMLGGNNRIQKFDPAGVFVGAFGRYGVTDGEFGGRVPVGRFGIDYGRGISTGVEAPYGVAIGPNGLVYATDCDNERIQVFDRQGRFQFAFGQGILFRPRQLDIDSSGRVYTTGFHTWAALPEFERTVEIRPENRRVWVFSPEGQLLLEFGHKESGYRWGHEDIGGGKHHSICVDKVDESLVWTQGGYVIDQFRIQW
jgi:DNA-binding beta-propeller fold protein YncE